MTGFDMDAQDPRVESLAQALAAGTMQGIFGVQDTDRRNATIALAWMDRQALALRDAEELPATAENIQVVMQALNADLARMGFQQGVALLVDLGRFGGPEIRDAALFPIPAHPAEPES